VSTRDRSARRRFLRELRAAVRAVPGVSIDVWIRCQSDGACCAVEPMAVTGARLNLDVEDWCGGHSAGAHDHAEYRRLKAAGRQVLTDDGFEVP